MISGRAVDELSDDVGMAGVPGSVEKHREQHPSE